MSEQELEEFIDKYVINSDYNQTLYKIKKEGTIQNEGKLESTVQEQTLVD